MYYTLTKFIRHLLFIAIILFSYSILSAQDFTDIKKRKAFTINGQIGAEIGTFLSSPPSFNRPFSYFLSVNLNPSIYGFSLPLMLSFGSNGLSYSHPFNIMEFTPSYKWIKAYIGRTSMFMSDYGLSSHSFDGIGVELTPRSIPISFSAMYGRLQKANCDSFALENEGPYKRMAYAFSVGLDYKKQNVIFNFFHAKDIEKSIKEPLANTPNPKQNIVADLNANFAITQKIELYVKGALSWYQDINNIANTDIDTDTQFINTPNSYKTPQIESYYYAAKAGIKLYGLDLSYERISPNFMSMGSYYFNNDFENITLGYGTQIKQIIDLNVRMGWQRDDLNKEKQSRMNRLIAEANLNLHFNEKWNLNMGYSNFTTHTKVKPIEIDKPINYIEQYIDSINYRQVSQQAQLNFSYTIGTKEQVCDSNHSNSQRRQSINFTLSFQESRSLNDNFFNEYFFASLSHSVSLKKNSFISSSILCNTQLAAESLLFQVGPNIAFNKDFLKDKSLNFSIAMQYYLSIKGNIKNTSLNNGVAGITGRLGYSLKVKHRFDILLDCRQRHLFSSKPSDKINIDFSGTLKYSYRF